MRSFFRLRSNSLQVKLLIFFFIVFLVLAAVLTYIVVINNRRVQSLHDFRTIEETSVLKDKLDNSSQLAMALAPDYSVWDDPYEYLNGELPNYAEENLTESVLDLFKSDAMWMFHSDSRLAYKINITEDTEGEIDFGPKNQAIKQLFEKSPEIHFYMKTRTGIMEIFGSTVVPSDDPEHLKPSPGYLLVGKVINDQTLSSFQGDEMVLVKLVTPEEYKNYPQKLPVGDGKLVFGIGFQDIDGNDIGYIYANYQDNSIRVLHNSDITLLLLNTAMYFSLLFIVLFVIGRWVVRPLNIIYDGLETGSRNILKELTQQENEFGKIAQLIDKFFEQEKLAKIDLEEKKKILDKLTVSNAEIELTNKAMVGRELKMIELKKKIKMLQDQLGTKP